MLLYTVFDEHICLNMFFFFIRMSCRVYVGRLPYHTREKDVERFFRGYGRIREIMLKNGYGFVVSLVTWFLW